MATGSDPNLAALVDSTLAGEAFDAAQERQALTRSEESTQARAKADGLKVSKLR